MFIYKEAFSRNIGWLTEQEQQHLREKRVAIAGMGGVGGFHLLTLVRLGIERFNIADFDVFEIANFNRQAGAVMSNMHRPKVDVLMEMAKNINPECDIRVYNKGVNAENMQDFFKEVDIYVDGLDFFAFEAREHIFEYCFTKNIPAVTVAPLGMSAALLNFLPGGMSFKDYFNMSNRTDIEKSIYFLIGLAPGLLHRRYIADKTRIDLKAKKGPSTIIACQLCAGIAASEALKILLTRGKIWSAPHGIQFDGYRNKLAHTWRPWGNNNPLNRIAITIAKKQLGLTD